MKNAIVVGTLFLLGPGATHAETLSFPSVWSKIESVSTAQEASRLQGEALTHSKARASRHWLPKLYLDVKSYQTNDPGPSFFGLLEQRSVTQSDFNPSLLNRPGGNLYTQGTLGLNLPLYEGGMKSSNARFFEHALTAQNFTTTQVKVEQYAGVGLSYGSLAILEQQKTQLQNLSLEVDRMIKSYRLGSRSNPVGYSGLLGLKALANRLNGLINQYDGQSRSHSLVLTEMGLSAPPWSPEKIDSNTFVNRYFSNTPLEQESHSSYKVEATREKVKTSEEISQMEMAKFLPRIGAFAETTLFNGSRDTASAYNTGLYLQWNLFDPTTYGSLKEAKLSALAASKHGESLAQQERGERASLAESLKSLRQNLELLKDSQNLLLEQSKVTETLFKNGSINALQLVELFSRRADLIAQQSDAELGLLTMSSQLITKQKFDIEQVLNSGVKNETR